MLPILLQFTFPTFNLTLGMELIIAGAVLLGITILAKYFAKIMIILGIIILVAGIATNSGYITW